MANKAADEPSFNYQTMKSDNTTVISWWDLIAAGVDDSRILNIIRQVLHHVSSSFLGSLLRNSILLHRLFEIGKTNEATKTEETPRVVEVGREAKETLGGGIVSVDAADWDSLPEGLMIEIAERIDFYEGFEIMYKINRRWRSAMRMADFRFGGGRSMIQFPWLMLSPEEEKEKRATARFYSFSKHMFRSVPFPSETTTTTSRRTTMDLLSSHGWLLIVPSWEPSLSLFNPLSGTYIQLPDNSSLDYETAALGFPFFVYRWCLSCSPSSNPGGNFQVLILTGKQNSLALWRPGDTAWTSIETSHLLSDSIFTDVTYYKGEFVAVTFSGMIVTCSSGDGWKDRRGEEEVAAEGLVNVRLITYTRPLLKRTRIDYPYLVVVDDKLIIVARRVKKHYSFPKRDLYMMIEVDMANRKATEVYDLGVMSIFLGERNEGFSIEATSRNGCKPNCMYFADYVMGPETSRKAVGIFNLDDGIYEHHSKAEVFGETPLLWIEPRF